MRAIFPIFLTVAALAGCESTSVGGQGADVIVPDSAYHATHSQGDEKRMKFAADGQVLVWADGAYIASGGRWFRRDGKLCAQGRNDSPDQAFCAEVLPTGNGGFNVIYEDAMAEFRPIAE